MTIGSASPVADAGTLHNVSVIGCGFASHAVDQAQIDVYSGLGVSLVGNDFDVTHTAGVGGIVRIYAKDEDAGTAVYTQDLLVALNAFRATKAAGSIFPVQIMDPTVTAPSTGCGARMTFLANANATPETFFNFENGALLYTNITVLNQEQGGLGAGVTVSASNAAALSINAGTTIRGHLSGTVTWDPPNLAIGDLTSKQVTVTGAAMGDTVAVGLSTLNVAGLILSGAVTAPDTVTVSMINHSAGAQNLAEGTLRADVWKH